MQRRQKQWKCAVVEFGRKPKPVCQENNGRSTAV